MSKKYGVVPCVVPGSRPMPTVDALRKERDAAIGRGDRMAGRLKRMEERALAAEALAEARLLVIQRLDGRR